MSKELSDRPLAYKYDHCMPKIERLKVQQDESLRLAIIMQTLHIIFAALLSLSLVFSSPLDSRTEPVCKTITVCPEPLFNVSYLKLSYMNASQLI